MTATYLAIFLAILAAVAAFSVGWSLKTGWASSKRYLIGRDCNRHKRGSGYWLVVGGNALLFAVLLSCAFYVFFNPPTS